MAEEDFALKYKIITLGNACVGKTSVVRRFVYNEFSESYVSTIGVDVERKTVKVNNRNINVQIWDTSGAERFQSLTPNYYRNISGALMVYDITNIKSFKSVERWVSNCQKFAGENVKIMLIGNKCDLEDQRQVTFHEGLEVARENNMRCMETSAKDDINITQALMDIVLEIDEMRMGETPTSPVVTLENENTAEKKCCG